MNHRHIIKIGHQPELTDLELTTTLFPVNENVKREEQSWLPEENQ